MGSGPGQTSMGWNPVRPGVAIVVRDQNVGQPQFVPGVVRVREPSRLITDLKVSERQNQISVLKARETDVGMDCSFSAQWCEKLPRLSPRLTGVFGAHEISSAAGPRILARIEHDQKVAIGGFDRGWQSYAQFAIV